METIALMRYGFAFVGFLCFIATIELGSIEVDPQRQRACNIITAILFCIALACVLLASYGFSVAN